MVDQVLFIVICSRLMLCFRFVERHDAATTGRFSRGLRHHLATLERLDQCSAEQPLLLELGIWWDCLPCCCDSQPDLLYRFARFIMYTPTEPIEVPELGGGLVASDPVASAAELELQVSHLEPSQLC